MLKQGVSKPTIGRSEENRAHAHFMQTPRVRSNENLENPVTERSWVDSQGEKENPNSNLARKRNENLMG
ncbi:hypothetical protein JHK84_032599 [Glycine max]|nr:hypothetical protein JHK84_032599 [Glycine max]